MHEKLRLLIKAVMRTSKYALMGMLLQCLLVNVLLAERTMAQDIYRVSVHISIQDRTLKEVLDLIEHETEYRFTYSASSIDLSARITVADSETNLGRILDIVGREAGVRFRQVENVIMMKRAPAHRTQASGTITGVVTDAQTAQRLPGATVRIKGSASGTVTDLNGEFALRTSDGDVEIEVSYIGFTTLTQQVSVPAGGTVHLDLKMNSDVTELENVIVIGLLQGQQRALNQQKSADNIKNVVSADQIGRFPDPNVAEALQRVPAVNIERDQGEGRYVLVRGLAPQFTNVSINGEQIPSPEAGVRYVALDAVPADQLASIEVSKSITPDMDGDAIGGSVNLITRKAQTSTLSVRSSALMGYNNIVGKSNFQGSLELSRRFLNDKLGIMLNASYYETNRGSDNWESDDPEMELRDYELVRTRLGVSGTIDYKFSEQSNLYFRGIYNRFTDRELRRRYVFKPNADASPFEDNEIERLVKDRLEKQIVSSFNFGGKHALNKVTLDYEVAYAEAIQDTPFDIEIATVGSFDDLSIDFDTDPEFPSFQVNGKSHRDKTNDYLDNSNYEFDEFTSGNTYALDVNKTAKANVAVPYSAGTAEGLFKFGGKVRLKEKSFDITENVYGWEGGDVTFPGFEAGDYTLEKFSERSADNNFLDGKYHLSPNIDVEKVINHFNQNQAGYELDVEGKQIAQALESYTASEDVYAGYLMTKLQFARLMLLGGVRLENTHVKYQSSEVIYDFEGNLDEIRPIEGSTQYTFVLPQLHAKYEINDQANLRVAITRSYARPNFQDIVPSQEIDLNAREGSIGNPDLKPVGAWNVDLLGERYFGSVGILSGGVFYKRLSDFIFNQRFETNQYPPADGTTLELTQAQNGDQANLFGFELAYQQNLSFLPGFLKGVSVYANYTFTHSKASIQHREDNTATESIRLPGQARHVGNLSFGYEIGRVNFRISSNFNGEYLSELGGDAAEDLYVKDRMQLDATAAVAINSKIRFFAEFLNITNQPFEVYRGESTRYIQREFYSWWTRVGLKLDL